MLPIEAECSESEICIISLACVSSETHNLRRVFLRIKETQKGRRGGGVIVAAVPVAETVETGDKNRCVIEGTNVLRGKFWKD